MNTFAKIGRIALAHLFTKKEVFITTRYEELGMVNLLPKKISLSKEPIDLEKEYLGHMVGALGRENNYKIFFWSVELGLTEIILVSNENEGRLVDLLVRFIKGIPTHIIVAEKKYWHEDESPYEEWESDLSSLEEELLDQCSQEEIIISSLTEEQKQFILSSMVNEEENQFENNEEFIFKHGYFPKD